MKFIPKIIGKYSIYVSASFCHLLLLKINGEVIHYCLLAIYFMVVQYCDEMKYGSWQCFRENEQYKNPANDSGWRRPPVEEVKLLTAYALNHN